MAYLLTAIMTGGVASILTLYFGGTLGTVLWNYVLYGHLGMIALACATVTFTMIDRKANSDV